MCFGDRVAVLNVMFFGYGGSILSTEYKLLSFLGFKEEDKSSTATFNFSIFNDRRGGHTTSLATSELPSVQQ